MGVAASGVGVPMDLTRYINTTLTQDIANIAAHLRMEEAVRIRPQRHIVMVAALTVDGAEVARKAGDVRIHQRARMSDEFQNGLGKPVTANFFHGCVDDVAAKLIGCFLFVEGDDGRLGGQIIETEAYCEHDPASHCHSAASRRRRNLSDPCAWREAISICTTTERGA